MGEDRPSRFVLDLSQVTFMDTYGITILLQAHKALGHADGWRHLAGNSTQVARAVELVRLDSVIPCCATRRAALSA